MRSSRQQLLDHVAALAEEGAFGDSVRQSRAEYDALPQGLAVFLKAVDDYCQQNENIDQETRRFRDLVCQLLITAYRDAHRASPESAEPFLASLISDYPGAPESALLTRWCSLAQASLAFQEVQSSNNRNLVWQQSEKLFVAYNEFLDGLFGFVLVLLRCSSGQQVKAGVFQCPYGDKVHQLDQLTGGESGAYFLLTRIARPSVRNASAHGRLWLDPKQGLVRYVDGLKDKTEKTIPLVDFLALVHLGSHLSMPYFAAVGTLVALDSGGAHVRQLLPSTLVALWDHEKGTG